MISIDGNHLTIEQVAQVARYGGTVAISDEGIEQIKESRKRLEKIITKNNPVYGINTGFGLFSDQRISLEDSTKLSRNLILSHAVATGPRFSNDQVRAAMLIRANALTKGYSGVRLELVQTLVDMLNIDLTPIVPSQGSLGSSGDLCLLSQMALVFTRSDHENPEESGFAEFQGKTMRGSTAMNKAGIPRIILGAKEGLALNNGATFSAGLASLAITDTKYLVELAFGALALSLEALMGCSTAYNSQIHMSRGIAGQITVADKVRKLTLGSGFIDKGNRIQDAYSLRCAPQVQGPVLDILEFAYSTINNEINAATDNPLVFSDDEVISGGNFHGEPIGLVMDYLGIAVAELGAISERRTFRLLDARLNGGLPPMLVDKQSDAGLNSGLMMPHYTAASLVLENQTLAHPDTVNSLPTSGDQEDHNSNSTTAARHCVQIINNVKRILTIELYTACRALDLRLRTTSGTCMGIGTQKIFDQIRNIVPYSAGDALWGPEIDRLEKAITANKIIIGV